MKAWIWTMYNTQAFEEKPNLLITSKIEQIKSAFNIEFPPPHTEEQKIILLSRINRAKEVLSSTSARRPEMPENFVGIVVGGQVRGQAKLALIKDVVSTIIRMGWGINSSAQTHGDRIVIETAHEQRGFSVGYFVNRMGHPYLRKLVSSEVNEYARNKFGYAEDVYNSTGKPWEFLSIEQQKSIVKLIDIARFSKICILFDTPDVMSSMFVRFAAAYDKPVFYLPQDMRSMLDALVQTNNGERR